MLRNTIQDPDASSDQPDILHWHFAEAGSRGIWAFLETSDRLAHPVGLQMEPPRRRTAAGVLVAYSQLGA